MSDFGANLFVDAVEHNGRALPSRHTKVTIVGIGAVGMACAYSLCYVGLCSELVLSDIEKDKLKGEALDLQHGTNFHRTKITAAEDYEATKDSTICVVSAGVRQRDGETRDELVGRNRKILQQIIPNIVKHSPDVIFVVVTNPVDVISQLIWQISGLPPSRVIGTGTLLDSFRLRSNLAKRLNVSPSSVHGYIIGEHGDASIPCWNSVNVAGVSLIDANTEDLKKVCLEEHKKVVQAAYEVIHLKGYTNWAIGSAVGELVTTILQNRKAVLPVSTLAKGAYGIEADAFLSLPCVVDRNGVNRIVKLNLTEDQLSKLRSTAEKIAKITNTDA